MRKKAVGSRPASIATREVSRGHRSIRGMELLLTCPWCEDEARFSVDEGADEVVCTRCDTRLAFAPDPVATFELLYTAA